MLAESTTMYFHCWSITAAIVRITFRSWKIFRTFCKVSFVFLDVKINIYIYIIALRREHRLYWIYPSSSGRSFVVSRFSSWPCIPCVSLYTVYSSSIETTVHSRAGCLPRAAGTRAAVCRSCICTVFPRNWVGIAWCARRVHWEIGHRK